MYQLFDTVIKAAHSEFVSARNKEKFGLANKVLKFSCLIDRLPGLW